ncbi:MAG TPA: VWA domain-containing protein [Terriglobales bacterium]|nr:VWA domain-containing protein [Terriglobales bacterium]
MFAIREYAAVLSMLLIAGALLAVAALLLWGIVYLLKTAATHAGRAVAASRAVPTRAVALVPILCVLALAFFVLHPVADRAQQIAAAPPDDYTINVSVNEVVLHATVRNHKGAPVAGLARNDFQILEDGVPQPIRHFGQADIPVTVGLVIDNSGSMRPRRAEVVAAALAFAASSNPQDEIFVVNFNEHVRFGLPREIPFTDEPARLRAALGTVKSDGKTALYDAVVAALEHLKQGNRDKKVLIVVSDGADNASTHTKAQMLELATRSDAILYGVGLYEPDDPDRNPHVVKELARVGGGEAYFPRELRDVVPTCERIAHAIRNQYTLTYVPTNQKKDGAYRTIQVQVTPATRDLTVITRRGYVAPSEAAPGAGKPPARD